MNLKGEGSLAEVETQAQVGGEHLTTDVNMPRCSEVQAVGSTAPLHSLAAALQVRTLVCKQLIDVRIVLAVRQKGGVYGTMKRLR